MKSFALFTILTLASFSVGLLPASAANQGAGDKETIFSNAKSFVDAFEKGDAKAVAVFWAEDGDYVDLDGRHLQGRTAIEDAFKEFFKENKA
jgi:ketosteroid isomerase-like protein